MARKIFPGPKKSGPPLCAIVSRLRACEPPASFRASAFAGPVTAPNGEAPNGPSYGRGAASLNEMVVC
jgi:hypothetical protein